MSIELIVFLKFLAWTIPALLLYGFMVWAEPRRNFLKGRKEKLANEKGRGA